MAFILTFMPLSLMAASIKAPDGKLDTFLQQLIDILNIIIQIVMGIAVVVFLVGIVSYVISKGAEDKEKARDQIVMGIIGLFVMVSVWGIVQIFTSTFFDELKNTPPALPSINR